MPLSSDNVFPIHNFDEMIMNNLKSWSMFTLSLCHATSSVPQLLPKPSSRSQVLHDKFVSLHNKAEQGQTVFGYWCGPTPAGYCGSSDFSDINMAAVTHVPFAFVWINENGEVSLNYDDAIDTTQLLDQGIIAGMSLGGAAANPNNCLNHIDTCVTTLGELLTTYEQSNSPFFFVDSDFEKPEDQAQMDNLIKFWLAFRDQYPEYLISMAPECAYLWCGDGGAVWPYNSYVNVINQLGPHGADVLYRINVQAYNNWCSMTANAGETQFNEDVAKTFIDPCPATGYLGLSNHTQKFGLGVLGSEDGDGDGYTTPEKLESSLDAIDAKYGTRNAMFWDTRTDRNNPDGQWAISSAMVKGLTQPPTNSPIVTHQSSQSQGEGNLPVYLGVGIGLFLAASCGVMYYRTSKKPASDDSIGQSLVTSSV